MIGGLVIWVLLVLASAYKASLGRSAFIDINLLINLIITLIFIAGSGEVALGNTSPGSLMAAVTLRLFPSQRHNGPDYDISEHFTRYGLLASTVRNSRQPSRGLKTAASALGDSESLC